MNIVETKILGSTKVNFCDDYCKDVSKQEIEEILKSITKKALPYLQKNCTDLGGNKSAAV